MNRFEIINEAREIAHLDQLHAVDSDTDGIISETEITDPEYKSSVSKYNLQLEQVLTSRPWLYAHDMKSGSAIVPVADDDASVADLGYKYRYKLSGVIEVLSINPNDSKRFRNIIPDTKQALRAGVSYLPWYDGVIPADTDKGFVYLQEHNPNSVTVTNGILHSDCEVNTAFVKKNVDIERTPASFQLYFAHVLGAYFAFTRGKNAKRAKEIEQMIPSLANQAIRDEKAFKTNPHYSTIINWISTYYSNANLLGGGY